MGRRKRDLRAGTVIGGRFTIGRPLARGGMATVYEAQDRAGDPIALKLAHPGDAFLAEALRQEGVYLERIAHPRVVRLVTHGPTEDGSWFLAMERVEGEPLTAWMRHTGAGPLDAVRVLIALGEALAAVHGCGLVHRDLKASNVLVRDGRPTLIDFGIAGPEGEAAQRDGRPLLGGFHTSAPEQIRGEPVDRRADIYAFGVLLYRVLAGRYPFHGKNGAEVLAQHVHAPIPTLPATSEEVRALEPVVRRCLAKSPDARFPHMEALLDALRRALGDAPPSRTETRHRLGVVLAIAVLTGAAWWWFVS